MSCCEYLTDSLFYLYKVLIQIIFDNIRYGRCIYIKRNIKQTKGIDDAFFSVYGRLPNGVKHHTDKYVKLGLKTGRKLKPLQQKSRAMGDAWYENHINRRVKVITGLIPKKRV